MYPGRDACALRCVRRYVKQLAAAELLSSELGYYLACFEAALTYTLEFALPPADGAPAPAAAAGSPADGRAAAPPASAPAAAIAAARAPLRNTGGAAPAAASGDKAARRELARFLHQERVIDDLVGSLAI